ncbi:MAG: hypothetical protein VX768_10860 [Planctomycetota bacterium]|nr:hypothetical protein [Planctomycetota bacterium]
MTGPQFLAWYAGCFFVYGFLTLVIRKMVHDMDFMNHAALVGLLGMGIVRLIYSLFQAKYKFGFLIIEMLVTLAVFTSTRTGHAEADKDPFAVTPGGLVTWKFCLAWLGASFGFTLLYLIALYLTPQSQNLRNGTGTLPSFEITNGNILFFLVIGIVLFAKISVNVANGRPFYEGLFDGRRGQGGGGCGGCGGCGGGCDGE